MRALIFLLLILACSLAGAQEIQMCMVKKGSRPRDIFTYSDIYLFPTFCSGTVHFSNDRTGYGRMNYNRYTKAFDFINGKDTLELTDRETIKSIEIEKNIFYYQVGIGYIQYLKEASDAAFGKMEKIQYVGQKHHYVSNGTPNYFNTPGGGSVNSRVTRTHMDALYFKKADFYFANKNGFFLMPTKKNVMKIFPKKKEIISAYLQDHQVDFKNEESLRSLFAAITDQQ